MPVQQGQEFLPHLKMQSLLSTSSYYNIGIAIYLYIANRKHILSLQHGAMMLAASLMPASPTWSLSHTGSGTEMKQKLLAASRGFHCDARTGGSASGLGLCFAPSA